MKFAFLLLLLLLFVVVPRLSNSDAKGGIKKEPNAQSLGQENPLFFIGRHTTAAGRKARRTEVGPQRPEAGSTTDPITPTEPAVGMRAGR